MSKVKKYIVLLLAVLLTQSFIPGQSNSDQEYTLKAAFLYRFSDYVEWVNNSDEYFHIAVLGSSPIISQLNLIADNKRAKNKAIHISQHENINGLEHGNILFVSKNCHIPIESILAKYSESGMLIVTEQEGYCSRGADVNFVLTGDKLRFEINQRSINKPKFKISSQLLQHATIID